MCKNCQSTEQNSETAHAQGRPDYTKNPTNTRASQQGHSPNSLAATSTEPYFNETSLQLTHKGHPADASTKTKGTYPSSQDPPAKTLQH